MRGAVLLLGFGLSPALAEDRAPILQFAEAQHASALFLQDTSRAWAALDRVLSGLTGTRFPTPSAERLRDEIAALRRRLDDLERRLSALPPEGPGAPPLLIPNPERDAGHAIRLEVLRLDLGRVEAALDAVLARNGMLNPILDARRRMLSAYGTTLAEAAKTRMAALPEGHPQRAALHALMPVLTLRDTVEAATRRRADGTRLPTDRKALAAGLRDVAAEIHTRLADARAALPESRPAALDLAERLSGDTAEIADGWMMVCGSDRLDAIAVYGEAIAAWAARLDPDGAPADGPTLPEAQAGLAETGRACAQHLLDIARQTESEGTSEP